MCLLDRLIARVLHGLILPISHLLRCCIKGLGMHYLILACSLRITVQEDPEQCFVENKAGFVAERLLSILGTLENLQSILQC